MDNRAKFENWLITTRTERQKKESTAYNYSIAIKRIAEHYYENTKISIDFFTSPIELIEKAESLYGINGEYSVFGQQGNGTIRNALAALIRFRKSPDILIEKEVYEEGEDETFPNFHYENDLQETILFQINDLFPEFRIYGRDNEEGIKYKIGGKEIDILLESKDGKSLLIIELKAGTAKEKVFGQIAMYYGLIIKEFPEKDVKGLVIAQEISSELINAGLLSDKISFMSYLLQVNLTNIV